MELNTLYNTMVNKIMLDGQAWAGNNNPDSNV